jgi:carboxypeptidase C (cathepsin A)
MNRTMNGKMMMKNVLALGALSLVMLFPKAPRLAAQDQKDAKPADAKPADQAAPKEESSATDHSIRIGGQAINYKATASTTLLKDDKGEPTASIFSIAYTRSDSKDMSQRPIAFVYNGGPGSSSVWLHMGAFGPRRIVTAEAVPTPPPPYKIADNSGCLLDKADLVFIDPVGTGFSRAVGKATNKDFWGVDQDVHSLAQFITTYVARNNRWNSPKFLIGESYGTFRSVALGNYLQEHESMHINGIVLISSVLDAGTLSFSAGNDMTYIFYLPSYAATAWVHNVLSPRPDDLNAFLTEARQFASTEYAAALMKGSHLSDNERADIAKKLAHFTGLSEDYIIKAELRVTLGQFRAELQRGHGLTIGRYDSRFTGPTYDLLTEDAESDPSYTAVAGGFAAAINSYLREDLKFSTEKTYNLLNFEVGGNWDWKHAGGGGGFPGAPNVEGDLIHALISNPHLQVQVENGFYDMATPFFATEFTMDHLLLPGDLRQNIHLDYYNAGHMMYLHEEDHDKLSSNVRSFIDSVAKR